MDRSFFIQNKFRFKDFLFPCNPKKFSITHSKNIASYSSPFNTPLSFDIGMNNKIVSGEGFLFGDDAFSQYSSLSNIFSDPSPGLLHIPHISSFSAIFSNLSIIGEGLPNLITYSFSFIENKYSSISIPPITKDESSIFNNSFKYDISISSNISSTGGYNE
ncbi:MAG: DNA circularization N-terminal domain-containing protein [Oscillospiraceae bacterium]|nr:DNA circularization N-terminal domain-containing protein [Oscillospiraceae bacterium]